MVFPESPYEQHSNSAAIVSGRSAAAQPSHDATSDHANDVGGRLSRATSTESMDSFPSSPNRKQSSVRVTAAAAATTKGSATAAKLSNTTSSASAATSSRKKPQQQQQQSPNVFVSNTNKSGNSKNKPTNKPSSCSKTATTIAPSPPTLEACHSRSMKSMHSSTRSLEMNDLQKSESSGLNMSNNHNSNSATAIPTTLSRQGSASAFVSVPVASAMNRSLTFNNSMTKEFYVANDGTLKVNVILPDSFHDRGGRGGGRGRTASSKSPKRQRQLSPKYGNNLQTQTSGVSEQSSANNSKNKISHNFDKSTSSLYSNADKVIITPAKKVIKKIKNSGGLSKASEDLLNSQHDLSLSRSSAKRKIVHSNSSVNDNNKNEKKNSKAISSMAVPDSQQQQQQQPEHDEKSLQSHASSHLTSQKSAHGSVETSSKSDFANDDQGEDDDDDEYSSIGKDASHSVASVRSAGSRKSGASRKSGGKRLERQDSMSSHASSAISTVATKARETFTYLEDIRQLLGKLLGSEKFQLFIVVLIIVNAAMMGIGTFDFVDANPQVNAVFDICDTVFLYIFTIELCFQFIYHGYNLFLDGWLLFDTAIVVLSWSLQSLQVVRAFRIFRAFRLITRLKVLKDLVTALFEVAPSMSAIIALLALILYIFAVLCTSLFMDLYSEGLTQIDYFSSLDISLFTLFVMMTLEWEECAREVMDVFPYAAFIFSAFVIFTSFILYSLIIAVVCDAVKVTEEGNEEEEKLFKQHDSLLKVADLHARVDKLATVQDDVLESLQRAVTMVSKEFAKEEHRRERRRKKKLAGNILTKWKSLRHDHDDTDHGHDGNGSAIVISRGGDDTIASPNHPHPDPPFPFNNETPLRLANSRDSSSKKAVPPPSEQEVATNKMVKNRSSLINENDEDDLGDSKNQSFGHSHCEITFVKEDDTLERSTLTDGTLSPKWNGSAPSRRAGGGGEPNPNVISGPPFVPTSSSPPTQASITTRKSKSKSPVRFNIPQTNPQEMQQQQQQQQQQPRNQSKELQKEVLPIKLSNGVLLGGDSEDFNPRHAFVDESDEFFPPPIEVRRWSSNKL